MSRVLHMGDMSRQHYTTDTLPEHMVYIGRPSKWGNPFVIGRDGDRDEVVAKYREYVEVNRVLKASLMELEGKDLVCWCAPKPCHGDVLLQLLEEWGS